MLAENEKLVEILKAREADIEAENLRKENEKKEREQRRKEV